MYIVESVLPTHARSAIVNGLFSLENVNNVISSTNVSQHKLYTCNYDNEYRVRVWGQVQVITSRETGLTGLVMGQDLNAYMYMYNNVSTWFAKIDPVILPIHLP